MPASAPRPDAVLPTPPDALPAPMPILAHRVFHPAEAEARTTLSFGLWGPVAGHEIAPSLRETIAVAIGLADRASIMTDQGDHHAPSLFLLDRHRRARLARHHARSRLRHAGTGTGSGDRDLRSCARTEGGPARRSRGPATSVARSRPAGAPRRRRSPAQGRLARRDGRAGAFRLERSERRALSCTRAGPRLRAGRGSARAPARGRRSARRRAGPGRRPRREGHRAGRPAARGRAGAPRAARVALPAVRADGMAARCPHGDRR